MTKELNPCPFCGSEKLEIIDVIEDPSIHCMNCGVMVYESSCKEELIRHWNSRGYLRTSKGNERGNSELKLCPLCGCNDYIIHAERYKPSYIKCTGCSMKVEFPVYGSTDASPMNILNGLIEDWNRRVME